MKLTYYILLIFAIFASCTAEQKAARKNRSDQRAERRLVKIARNNPGVIARVFPETTDTITKVETVIIKDTVFIKGDTATFTNIIDTTKQYQNFTNEDSTKIIFVEVIKRANAPPEIRTTATIKDRTIYEQDTTQQKNRTIIKTKTITKTVYKTPFYIKILFWLMMCLLIFFLIKSQSK